MNFFYAQIWLLLRQLPQTVRQAYRVRAIAWEKETGTKPRLIFLAAAVAVLWAYAAIQFVGWVGDLIRYVA